jgi:cyclophilin family peptidyl-prolyl cis-trans isomerase
MAMTFVGEPRKMARPVFRFPGILWTRSFVMRRDARSFVGSSIVSSLLGKVMGRSSGKSPVKDAGKVRGKDVGWLNMLEPLEPRQMLAAAVALPMADLKVNTTDSTTRILSVANLFKDDAINGTVVEFTFLNIHTTPSKVNVELFDGVTTQTVANFLKYVSNNKWDNSIIHRAIRDFVVQGGGFTGINVPITAYDPIINEAYYSNKRGTIAMAKQAGDPNSASGQWFFNVKDNGGTAATGGLDYQNGGFTVFGRVLGTGMDIIDDIAEAPTYSYGSNTAFTDLPLINFNQEDLLPQNFVRIEDIKVRKEVVVTGATSSNNALVTTSFDADGNLKLNILGDATGKVNITVTGVSADGSVITDTFEVTVGDTGASPMTNSGSIDIDFTRPTNITEQLFGLTSGGLRDSLTILSKPSHGSLAFDSVRQQIFYIPEAGYLGTDTFTYTLRNSAGFVSAPGTVSLVNTPVVTLGGGADAIQELIFTNSAGKNVSIKYQSGTNAKVRFSGSPTQITIYGNTAVLQGTNLDVQLMGVELATSTTSATSTNTGLVTPTVGASGVSLAFGAGVFGAASLTINAVTAAGNKSGQFLVSVLNNYGPTAGNATFIAEFNRLTNITQQIFALTSDADGTINKSTFRVVQQPAHGTVFFDPDTLQVIYQPDAAFTGSDTFTYTVLDNNNLPSNVGTITMTTSKVITLSSQQGGIKQLIFTDADGSRVVLSLLGAGSVKAEFSGSLTSFTTFASTGVISGASAQLISLLITGTTSASVVTLTSDGGSATSGTSVTSVTLTSDLGAFYAPTVNLGAGGFVASAGADLGSLRVGDVANNGDIVLPGTNPGMLVSVGDVGTGVDMSINSMAQSVRARTWASGNLNALGLESMMITQSVVSGMKLTTGTESQTIRWVMFAGGLGATGGTNIAGGVGQMLVLGTTTSTSNITIGNSVQKFLATSSLGGTLSIGGDVNTLKVLGNVSQATVNVGSVGSMVVGGNLVDTTVRVTVGIQNFLASQMINSSLLVAVNGVGAGDLLPSTAGQFTGQAGYIGFVGLAGSLTSAGFQDSRIAGKTLINARLGYVKTSNASEGFGVSALAYTGLIRMTILEDNKSASFDSPATQAEVTSEIALQTLTTRDFLLRVVSA